MTARTISSRLGRVALPLLLLSTFASPAARAQSPGAGPRGVLHKIGDKGETYEDLAEHYYGRRYLALHLRLFNRRAEPLARGTTIIVPTYTALPLAKGQTLEQFAEQNLSDAARADYLAELHALRGPERAHPKPGTRLFVVPSLKHWVRPGESLRTIARLYYRDVTPERLKLLMLFNGLASQSLKPSMSLRIPLDEPEFAASAVAARARRPFEKGGVVEVADAERRPSAQPAAKKRPAPRPRPIEKQATPSPPEPSESEASEEEAGDEVAKPIEVGGELDRKLAADREALDRSCSDGEWAACEAGARRLFDAIPTSAALGAVRIEVLYLRAVALVALGKRDDARETFKRLLALDPEYDLDLYRTSPKVLDVFQSVAER